MFRCVVLRVNTYADPDRVRYRGEILAADKDADAKWRQAHLVSFSFPDPAHLTVVIRSSEGDELLSRTFDAEEHTCDRGTVTIRRVKWAGGVAPPAVPGIIRDSVFLDFYPLETALVARRRIHTSGVIAVIPVRDRQTTWYRFERVPGGGAALDSLSPSRPPAAIGQRASPAISPTYNLRE